jgi:hypothetical protein
MMGRIRKLEEAVFDKLQHQATGVVSSTSTDLIVRDRDLWRLDLDASTASVSTSPASTPASASLQRWTPFELHHLSVSSRDHGAFVRGLTSDMISRNLPPRNQAKELFEHFVRCVQPTFGVLHIPSTREMLERTYQGMLDGDEPSPAVLLLLFSIFAGVSMIWTQELLDKLGATPATAPIAFATYRSLAISLSESVPPSTVALAGISTLIHQFTTSDGFGDQVHVLRTRAFVMARTMQISRLDTKQNCEARRIHGSDMVEIEVQRRIWWNSKQLQ